MKRLRSKLTYANVVASLALFLVVAGGSALAAGHLGKNSVGSKQLKNNAVTAAKIKKEAVTAVKIKNGAITGAKVNAGSLGTVPSATTATSATTAGTASSLAGQTSFDLHLNLGASQTVATNGAVSIVATCSTESGDNYTRLLAQTTAPGAVMQGQDEFTGQSSSLEPGTPADERELAEEYEVIGKTYVSNEEDSGFVAGPEGKALSFNGDGLAIGVNFAGSTCYVAGVINSLG